MSGYWDEFNVKGDTRKFRDTEAREQLETKAEIDGYYEEMTVGNAEQLISSVYVEDSEPYKYRTSGGSADIGNREYDEIVGGTVAWNQLNDDNFTDTSKWSTNATGTISVASNVLTLELTADLADTSKYIQHLPQIKIPTGHKALVTVDIYPSVTTNTRISYATVANGTRGVNCEADKWTRNAVVLDSISGASTMCYISLGRTLANGDTIKLKNYNIFDLTQMFGTTIADYIYSLEQTTAGAGVAWFRKYFPNDYYEYNSGELISIEGLSSHDMVGFNQWDEEWELGSFESGTGLPIASNTIIRAKNYINIIPNTVYCFTAPTNGVLYWYDANNTYISETSVASGGVVKTSPTNARYLKFRMVASYGTTYNNDVCINLSWSGSRNGDYEKYVKHSYALDDSLTLRGIPKLSDGKLTFDGDIYASDGTVTRNFNKIVLNGSENWLRAASDPGSRFYITGTPYSTVLGKSLICDKYFKVSSKSNQSATEEGDVWTLYGQIHFYPTSEMAPSGNTAEGLAEFKAWLSTHNVTLVYPITPTTETAEPFQSPQIVDDYGTEEYVSTTIVPVGHNTKYMANSVDKLNHLPTLADSDGDYVIRQSGTQMSLIPLTQVKELPDAPSTDGTYTLKVTVTDGEATYSWEVES